MFLLIFGIHFGNTSEPNLKKEASFKISTVQKKSHYLIIIIKSFLRMSFNYFLFFQIFNQ